MYCIETKDLTYKFVKDEPILNNINLKVPTGSIYGFLGPNGAGKTTTLKLILGLLRIQQGGITVLNKQINKDRIGILRQVGSLIEAPSLYAHLTARENLRLLQKAYQCPEARIQQVLDIVGLPATGKKKAGSFSLGMKQRLSIAIALLPSPSLLILDEPTNGLDPNGIIEIRALLKALNTEHNMTIVVSSHLLSEIEKIATNVGIINKGRILFQGTLEDLLKRQPPSAGSLLETSDNAMAIQALSAMGLTAIEEHNKVVLPVTDKEVLGNINDYLAKQGIRVYGISTVNHDLETIFIDLLKN